MEDNKQKNKKQEKGNKPPNGPAEQVECSCDEHNECVCDAAAPQPAAQKKAEEPAQDYYNQLLRLKADFENYRKRVEKDRPDLIKFGKAEILLKLLPLYDLLMQAHLHVVKAGNGCGENPAPMQDVVKGLEMIFKEFSKVFEQEGIRQMELLGKPYDPMACEIIGVDDGDEQNDGLVTSEFQKGFYYGDKILRPARVRIARKKAPPTSGEGK